MHRPAFALAVAGGSPIQLGKHIPDLAAFGQHISVPAVGAGDIVVLAQRGAGTHRHGLLALRQVQEPGHLAGFKALLRRVLEPANQAHAPIHAQQLLFGQIFRRSFLDLLTHRFSHPEHSVAKTATPGPVQ